MWLSLQGAVFIYIICICYALFYIGGIRKPSITQTFRLSLLKISSYLLCRPKRPVFSVWCSSCTDPNIMHCPSPENLHTAQQTDKYLIGQPSVPTPVPNGNSYCGHESTTGRECHVCLWESKPMWGQSLPCLTCGRLAGWCWRRLIAWLGALHRCQGITDE